MSVTLIPKLAKEYDDLFASCELNTEREKEVERIRERIVASKARSLSMRGLPESLKSTKARAKALRKVFALRLITIR